MFSDLSSVRNLEKCSWSDSGVPELFAHSEVREFRHDVEWRDPLRQPLRDEVDSFKRAVPEEPRCSIKMPHPAGMEAHQTRTDAVSSNGIIGEDELAKVTVGSV